MSYFEFPHTRSYEGDLGFVIKKIIEISESLNHFYDFNKIKIADPIEWSIASQYEAYTIVKVNSNNLAYISKRPVPSNIDITNTQYWESIGSMTIDGTARAQIQTILHMFADKFETDLIASRAYDPGDYVVADGQLYRVISSIYAGELITIGANVLDYTVEDMIIDSIDQNFSTTSENAISNKKVTERFAQVNAEIAGVNSDVQNAIVDLNALESDVNNISSQTSANTDAIDQEILDRQSEDATLSERINAIASLPSGSTSADAELMDIRISDQNNTYGSAGASVRAQANKNQATSTFRTYTRSVLVNNGWINNNGLYPQSSDSWRYSDPIDISAFGGSQLYIYFTATGFNSSTVLVNNIAFFDDNDVFLFGIHHPSANSETTYSDTIELPKYVKYMRVCSKNDNTKPFFVSLFCKQSMLPVDAANVIRNYIAKDIMYVGNSNGYLDTNGAFHSAPAATWHASPIKYTRGFNKVFYKLNANNAVAAIALYRADQTCIRVVSGSSSSYEMLTGVLDVSEATYIRFCFHADYTDSNFDDHVILYNEPIFNLHDSSNFHVVNKPLSFSGKRAVFFGDSITQGVVTPGTVTPNGYPTVFSNMVNMSYVNKGVSGASIYRVSGYPCIYDTVNATDLTDVDFVFIMGGANDWQLGVTPEQFRSGLNDILGLLSDFTGEIIFIAPVDMAGRKPIVTPAADLEAFRSIMKEVALMNDNSFVNGKFFDMPTARSSQGYIDDMFGDSIHPSEHGYRLIARGLRNALL